MMDSMDGAKIIEYFKGKNILITGSTGFLGKILVEKILRVQPHVNKLYLLVRAIDATSAHHRLQQEVTGTELFGLLREKHGEGFDLFIQDKVVPLAGDITKEDLGLEASVLEHLAKDMDVIVNIAATTNFYERYDVSLGVNAMGVKHMCQFAHRCANLEMFMHVSTAYVSGGSTELILEKPLTPWESLRDDGTARLDIDAELRLVSDVKNKSLTTTTTASGDSDAAAAAERKAMKELGLQRARHFGWSNTYVFTKAMGEMVLEQLIRGGDNDMRIMVPVPVVVVRPSIITSVRADPVPGWTQGARTVDTLIIGYAKQRISSFLADLRVVMDAVPGDMVVNAMLAAIVAHSSSCSAVTTPTTTIHYLQPTSSLRNPVTYDVLYRAGSRHFKEHPRVRANGEVIPNTEMRFFSTIPRFRLYMVLSYKVPLELLHMANLLLCGLFSHLYNDSNRKYKFVMHLVDVYGPFAFFKGCFDDSNLERLRSTMVMRTPEDDMFNFDPKSIDWDDYFYRIHIPGVIKYVCK